MKTPRRFPPRESRAVTLLAPFERRLRRIGLSIPEVLLPRPDVDLGLWTVAACDQFVHDDSYWERARRRVGDSPSALSLVLPEADLRRGALDDRIRSIHASMDRCLEEGLLLPADPGLVVVRRSGGDGNGRTGLLLAFDLEECHRMHGLRSTEEVVEDRMPARMTIREQASLEVPHLLVLVDDEDGAFENALDAARGRNLYDTRLPECEHGMRGTLVDEEDALESLVSALEGVARSRGSASPWCWFVGDGNHSLEAARRHWDALRGTLYAAARESHPARWVMAELASLRSPGLEILPVHRRIQGVQPSLLREAFRGSGMELEWCDPDSLREMLEERVGACVCGWLDGDDAWTVSMRGERIDAALVSVDGILRGVGGQIDYFHGWKEAYEAEGGDVVFVRAPTVGELRVVFQDGRIFPRKSFSLGGPLDKRHYLEARRIR